MSIGEYSRAISGKLDTVLQGRFGRRRSGGADRCGEADIALDTMEEADPVRSPEYGIGTFFLRLYGELVGKNPFHVASGIALFLGSRLSMLATMLLPWKLLVVLTTEIPLDWFPGARVEQQIGLLMGAIVGAFLVHMVCDMGFSWVCKNCSNLILKAHDKTGLFANYRENAHTILNKMLKSLANIVFCLIACLWIGAFYPLLLVALVGYVALSMAVLALWRRDGSRGGGWRARISRSMVVKAWWHVGFLACLGCVMLDYAFGNMPPLLLVFVGLILVRLVLGAVLEVKGSLESITRQRSRAEALFFRDATWHPRGKEAYAELDAVLDAQARETLLSQIAADHGLEGELQNVSVRSTKAGTVAYLKAEMLDEDGALARSVVLKLFGQQGEAAARHEAQLLNAAGFAWPALPLVAEGHTGKAFFLLQTADGTAIKWLDLGERTRAAARLRVNLMGCELPAPLVERYDRSRPSLGQKLARISWSRLRSLAEDSRTLESCDRLEENWADIIRDLEAAPRQLVLPSLRGRMMAATASGSGDVHICDWSNWLWLPVGSGWPVRKQTEQEIGRALEQAREFREVLSEISVSQAYMNAMLYALDSNYSTKKYALALRSIVNISDSNNMNLIN